MKTIIKALALTVVFAAPAFAAEDNQSAEKSVCKMTSEQMAGLQQRMQGMQELMAEIKKEKDPDKREAMVQQHLEEVESGMRTMTMQEQGAGQCKTLSSLPMEERMGLMEARTRMMALIMVQMVEQNVAQSTQHKRYQKR
jgi:hypothetical protein